jgi:hypothetical protein
MLRSYEKVQGTRFVVCAANKILCQAAKGQGELRVISA